LKNTINPKRYGIMKNMTLTNIAKAVNGQLFNNTVDEFITASGVVIDSREVKNGFIFIATKGERVDGHSFIDDVFNKGAIGVICEKAPDNPKGAYILVEDSFQALKDVAEFYREQLDIKVVGITGSVGKTSTKEFIASVLSNKYNVLKTEGNFNNEVGLPLTVLKIKDDCQVAVLEMGISDFGEMHRLSKIAKPDVCVITNIGQCHLENLGSRDGILRAKSEIFDYMNENGIICLNGDDDKLATLKKIKGIKPVFFGKDKKNDIYATNYENLGLEGSRAVINIKTKLKKIKIHARIKLPGEHMLFNALAATAVGIKLGLDISQISRGILQVKPVDGRSRIISNGDYTIIDDCYNANPVSMKAALDLLTCTEGPRLVAILGDMFELGENEAGLHYSVGEYAASKNIDLIICVGELSRNIYEGAVSVSDSRSKIRYYPTKQELFDDIKNLVGENDVILVKASHGMHFEDVVIELV
jgi:UDP-N-acetylmuramoyl-tripeptide--D-alanyl-D-alanine ligase